MTQIGAPFAGPEKKYPPLTGFDLLSKTGNAYEARKNDPKKEWQKQAYLVCSIAFRSFEESIDCEGNASKLD